MILQRAMKIRTFVILFLTVIFSISLLFYGKTLIRDLKDLSKSEIALFTESQILDQYFSEFQRALGFGGYIHNVKEYLLHRKQSQLMLMRLNIEELESSYASLREFFHDEESLQALQTIDNFLRVTRESYEVLLLPENQMLESSVLDSLLRLENPEILSALITLETFKENYNRRATKEIRSSIDEIVSDLLFASILLPIALLIGIYLIFLLKRSYKTSLELKKNEEEIEAKSKELETQLEKSEKQRIANLVILNDLNKTTKSLKLEMKERERAEAQVKRDLLEKNTLLQELYHRTKNNMQVISSMMSMEARRSDNELLKASFKEITSKINTMALVHQKLYQAKDLSRINLKEYIQDLANLVRRGFRKEEANITFQYEMDDIFVLIDTVMPLGLIINELITNAFKHAFLDDTEGEIVIKLKLDPQGVINLTLSDNGVGIPDKMDLRESQSMGLQTMFSLVEHQLQGKVEHENGSGLSWHIKLKDSINSERV